MSQSNKKSCIQKRILRWFCRNRLLSITISVALSLIIVFVLEALGFMVIRSFAQAMRDLEDMFPETFKGVATFLSGAFSFVFGRYIYDQYRKPQLKIVRFNELVTPNHRSWRVIVKNTGRTAAENSTCSIHLAGTDANGNNVSIKGSVCWSIIGNPNTITINVEDEQTLDIYRVANPQPNLHYVEIPTEKGWIFLREKLPLSRFVNPANLKIEIRITAKNVKPCQKTYSLRKEQSNVIMIA